MSKIWRLCPRRGKKSVLQKKNIVLKNGELIIELPNEGLGPISAKIGDGITRYNDLPYAFGIEVVANMIAGLSKSLNELSEKIESKAASSHIHDDRYFTESEMNTKLSTKSDTNHTHNYAASYHTHDDRYFTKSEILNNFIVRGWYTYGERVTDTSPRTIQVNVARSGYFPLIMSVDIVNASGGKNSSQMSIYGWGIDDSTGNAYVRIKPWVADAYVSVNLLVIYKKI